MNKINSVILVLIGCIIPIESHASVLQRAIRTSFKATSVRNVLLQRSAPIFAPIRYRFTHSDSDKEARAKALYATSIADEFARIKDNYGQINEKLIALVNASNPCSIYKGSEQVIGDLERYYKYQLPLAQANRDLLERLHKLEKVIEDCKALKDNAVLEDEQNKELIEILRSSEKEERQILNTLETIYKQPKFDGERKELMFLTIYMQDKTSRNNF